MSTEQNVAIAQELFDAYENGAFVAQPPSQRLGFDLNAAYEVELRLKQMREAQGHRSVGRKVGYANKAVWRVFKLETLVWAHMYDDSVHYTSGGAGEVRVPHARSLKVEPEIVFGMKRPLEDGADAAAALAAVDWLALGFEIIDCPYPDWKFHPGDFVASFGLHAALVVGEKVQVTADLIPALVEQLASFKARALKSGELMEEGSGKNSLKSPALCLAELNSAIRKRFPEEPLAPGELVSTGTLTAGHLASTGDEWRFEVEGISLPPLILNLK